MGTLRSLEVGSAPTIDRVEDDDPGELGELAEVVSEGDLAPGTMVGEYRIEGRIGAGGMGVVYGAVHPIIGKRVAIKVLNSQYSTQSDAVERFLLEARAVNRIGHPNIVDIFALGVLSDGRQYIAMEWLDGETLADRLLRGPMPIADACLVLDEIVVALEAAHAKSIVHRDLKPDNVFLQAGPRVRVKLLDFGIAKLTSGPRMRPSRTRTGNLIGTPHYVSPEQARGQQVDGRADVYSLGAVAYEMLGGEPPFDAPSVVDVVSMHLHSPPPPLSELVSVPAELEATIMSMLAKAPDERPSLETIREVLEVAHLREMAPRAPILDLGSGRIMRGTGGFSAVRISDVIPVGRPRTDGDIFEQLRQSGEIEVTTPAPPRRPASVDATPPVAIAAIATAPVAARASRRGIWRIGAMAAAVGLATVVAVVALRPKAPAPAAPAAPPAPPALAPAAAPPAAAEPLRATPARFEIVLAGSVKNARLQVDGGAPQPVDQRGRTLLELPPGPHTVVISAPGRTSVTRTVELTAGTTVVQEFDLSRAPRGRGAKGTRGSNATVDDDGVLDPFADP